MEGGNIVIRHWKQNNYIQADRYKKTIYQEQMALLGVSNGAYGVDTPCIQTVSKMETQDMLGKDSVDKDKKIVSNDTIRSTEVQRVVGEWNQLGICLSICRATKRGDVEFMSTLQATFRRLEEKTGIYARPHMLRHYFAQSRLDAGWKLPMIANALGHKDTRTTELYLRIPENERLVASKEYFEMYGSLIDEEEISL